MGFSNNLTTAEPFDLLRIDIPPTGLFVNVTFVTSVVRSFRHSNSNGLRYSSVSENKPRIG